MTRPKVALPKSRSFNEVVTLDLKEFGSKYILWMINSFTRFIQGKLIINNKVDTIIQALTDSWCMSVGFPSQEFFGNIGGEFANIKLDELTSKLGLTVKFGPSYSPWSNGLNKRNQASADITIKKLMYEYKTPLTDLLVKVAAWTHNTSVNKLKYSPLQLVTGQAVLIPEITTGNLATESMTDSEAVRRTMENLMRITAEFRESDMRIKLKDRQNVGIQNYQQQRNYVEGDKVWFQPLNGNAWIRPPVIVTQRGQSVYFQTHGDLKKIAACRVKP